ncbi:MAG: gamma-glutamyl-gamma-aminobutyrate hydrolase family protein [Candidatus Eisenbacteria sp.]|nr:gamma-glutamyl-gamma-aminobutyrate hydrolase family protein [Candidatus Eisenbacteria bacterium]
MPQTHAGTSGRTRPEDVGQRPRIGITLMLDCPEQDTHLPRYGMNRTYFESVRRAGGIPVPLAPGCSEEMRLYLAEREASGQRVISPPLALDGLCLAGGGDLDPSYFGQEKHPNCGEPEPERDAMEMTLLSLARNAEIPILAICRGIQVLNAAWGGTLIQDIASECPAAGQHTFAKDHPRDYLAHEIRIQPGSGLHEILGATALRVNSLHHQAVDRLGEGLVATAWAPDGIIEGLEMSRSDHTHGGGEGGPEKGAERFLIAVQFHPEDLQQHEPMRGLFTGLVDAARRYRRRMEA